MERETGFEPTASGLESWPSGKLTFPTVWEPPAFLLYQNHIRTLSERPNNRTLLLEELCRTQSPHHMKTDNPNGCDYEYCLNRLALRGHQWRLSDQDRSTINYQGLASAEFLLHQEQIGLR